MFIEISIEVHKSNKHRCKATYFY